MVKFRYHVVLGIAVVACALVGIPGCGKKEQSDDERNLLGENITARQVATKRVINPSGPDQFGVVCYFAPEYGTALSCVKVQP